MSIHARFALHKVIGTCLGGESKMLAGASVVHNPRKLKMQKSGFELWVRELCWMSKVDALDTMTPRIPATSSRVERSRTRQDEDARDRCLPRCLKDSCSNIPDACHQNRTRCRQPHREHRKGQLQQREREQERRACSRSGTPCSFSQRQCSRGHRSICCETHRRVC